MGDPLLDEIELLPDPDRLAQGVQMRTHAGGDTTPPTPTRTEAEFLSVIDQMIAAGEAEWIDPANVIPDEPQS
jgi:hypothetical protein